MTIEIRDASKHTAGTSCRGSSRSRVTCERTAESRDYALCAVTRLKRQEIFSTSAAAVIATAVAA